MKAYKDQAVSAAHAANPRFFPVSTVGWYLKSNVVTPSVEVGRLSLETVHNIVPRGDEFIDVSGSITAFGPVQVLPRRLACTG